MTTPTIEGGTEDDTDDDVDVPGARTPKLGAGMMHRLRLPGPGRDTTRPAPIGSVASSSARFATGLARSVPSRHQLRGPQTADVQSIRNMNSAPPRWWSPDLVPPAEDAGPPAPLTPRGLPRAVHQVPNEENRTPGGILGSLVSTTVPVRRMDAVVAAGPMLTSHDRQKLSAVAVNRSIARQTASAAEAAAAPAMPSAPAMPAPRPATTPPSAATPPSPAAQQSEAPADLGPAQPGPVAADSPPTGSAPADSTALDTGFPLDAPPAGPMAAAEPLRPRFRPERRSRLAAVRGPSGDAATAGAMGGGSAGGLAGGLAAGFPRSVGALALAGADPLASPATETPAHIRPLPRMVGGGHAVSAAANAGLATVAASDPLMFRAGRSAAEQGTSPTGAGAATTAPAATPAAVPSITSLASGPAAASSPTGTGQNAAEVGGEAGGQAAAGGSAAESAVAPGGGRGRRRASSEAVGIGLATARSLRPGGRAGDEVRPALSTSMLPTLGGTGGMAGAAHAWLPGAEQRAAGVRTSMPGALSLPGRTASLGMSDLLPSARGLAGSADSVTGPLASAFGAADLITPAGSAASAAPAPPTAAAAADSADQSDDVAGDGGSPLGAAQRRARSRLRSATTGASALASGAAGAVGAAGLAGATGAAAGAAGLAGAAGASLGSSLAPLKRLTDTTSGTAPATHMPAPPPVSIRSSAGGSVPPMSAAASLASSGAGGLKRSLIDVTAGMFDSLSGSPDADQATAAPPVPAVAQSDIGGSDMAEAERRLSVVRDGDTPTPAASSPLDDPAAMDNLVDEVVQRIEARVIDELERRGRRHNPGVF